MGFFTVLRVSEFGPSVCSTCAVVRLLCHDIHEREPSPTPRRLEPGLGTPYRNEIQPGKAIFPPNQHCVVCGSSEWAGVVVFPWQAGQHISVGDPGYDRGATFDVFCCGSRSLARVIPLFLSSLKLRADSIFDMNPQWIVGYAAVLYQVTHASASNSVVQNRGTPPT